MKKIGILNFHFGNKNYGAVLQAAALQYFLKKNGYVPQNIDFQPDGSFDNIFLDQLRNLKLWVKSLDKKKKNSTKIISSNAFDLFRKKWITVTEESFFKPSQLYKTDFNYYAYIVGSDQVWRNEYTGRAIASYFFSFVKSQEPKRVAYAASFGVDQWELPIKHKKTKKIVELIKQFDFVSVRERSGVEICKSTFGVNSELVIDPTLLVDSSFFDEIAEDSKFKTDSDYIALYKLDQDDEFLKYLNIVKEETDLEVIDIYKTETASEICYTLVGDWVAMIRGAKMVVTDSFHCCCLAVIYNKPFIFYPPKHNRGMTRIYNLFDMLCLDLVGLIKPNADEVAKFGSSVDYQTPNLLLKNWKDKSSAALLSALENG
ncbi:MAG: polysaccharide pyruvyl transferase family protein [Thermotogota bacterium]|nr:polysaccharide pyruvyl transferase family protein [Thermotogota bacterium]